MTAPRRLDLGEGVEPPSPHQPTRRCHETGASRDAQQPDPVAVLGYSIQLPQGVDSGEKLFELVRDNRQMAVHHDEVGYPPASYYGGTATDKSTWKYRALRGNFFEWDEAYSADRRLLRVPEKDLRYMYIGQALVLESVWRAIEDAGLKVEDLQSTRTGIFVGSYSRFPDLTDAPDEATVRGVLMSGLSDRVAYFLGTYGPSITMDTACSSSLTALSAAVTYLRKGDCDTAIVATVNHRSNRDYLVAMQAAGVMSESGYAHPFDEDTQGMTRAEGWGAMVLRRMRDAEANGDRIVATVVNVASGAAGAEEGVTEGSGRVYEAPCAAGVEKLLTNCYAQVNVSPEDVRYLEAHATGTRVGDLLELQGLAKVFRTSHSHDNPLRVGSVKGNIGHATTAAGLFSVIKVIEMLRRRTFLPSGGLRTPRSDFHWDLNNMQPALKVEPFPDDGRPVYIGVNSFGLGGGYAHCLLSEYNPPRAKPSPSVSPSPSPFYLLPLSAVSPEHLSLYEAELADYVRANPDVPLRDICGTYALKRSMLRWRRTYVVSDRDDLLNKLEAPDKKAPQPVDAVDAPPVAMVFSGQGAQWRGNGDALMIFPAYRNAVQAVDRVFGDLSGWSLLDRASTMTQDDLARTEYSQPITFMVQVGLFELLKSFGVGPSSVVGHSAGEVAAGYAAGLLTLEDAVTLIYHRSQEQQRVSGCGRMLAVEMGQADVEELLLQGGQAYQGVEVACVNSAQSVVLAGPLNKLQDIQAALPPTTRKSLLRGDIAFHSSHMEPVVHNLTKRLDFLDANKYNYNKNMKNSGKGKDASTDTEASFVSTVTGEVWTGPLDVDYWARNVRQPVLFDKAMRAVCSQSPRPSIVLELGPHPTLVFPAMHTIAAMGIAPEDLAVFSTLKRDTNDVLMLLESLANLMGRGYPVRLGPWYKREGYVGVQATEGAPGHPMIRKPLKSVEHFKMVFDNHQVGYNSGPAVGMRRGVHGHGPCVAEISELACPLMLDHNVGGQSILPGFYYVEAVLEAMGGMPCTLSNVEFVNACKIPKTQEGAVYLATILEPDESSADQGFNFKVQSTGSLAVEGVDLPAPIPTLHAQGKAMKIEALDVGTGRLDVQGMTPGAFGLYTHTSLRDLHPDGLDALRAAYPVVVAGSREEAYQVINMDTSVSNYGPSFRLIQEVYMDHARRGLFARITYEADQFDMRGNYAVQLLDACVQVTLLSPDRDMGQVWYFGGFKVCHFVRCPQPGDDVFVRCTKPAGANSVGRVVSGYDITAYDGQGRVLFALEGRKSIYGGDRGTIRLMEMAWQPYRATWDESMLEQLASLPPSPSSSVLARIIADLSRRKKQHSDSKAVVRVLECIESSDTAKEGTVLEALKGMTDMTDSGVIVEVYEATRDPALLDAIDIKTQASSSWLRGRACQLPQALTDMWLFAFDVIIMSDWRMSECGQSWGEKDRLGDILSQLPTPGGLVFFRGLDSDTAATAVPPQLPHTGKVTTYTAAEGEVVVAVRTPEERRVDQPVLVVGDDEAMATQLAKDLHDAEVILCGDGDGRLHDEADKSQWVSALAPLVGPEAATATATSKDRDIVFLAGVRDDSAHASNGFHRLVSLCQALSVLQADVSTKELRTTPAHKIRTLWVVTMGCFDGEHIRVGQASLYAASRHIEAELSGVIVRYVDLSGEDQLHQLSALIASRPTEKNFRISIDGTVPLAQRYLTVDRDELNLGDVSADDPAMAYTCDVFRDKFPVVGQVCVTYRGQPIQPPADDEVVVRIKAAGLNFRDVLLALSLLPVESLGVSAVGKALGMEGAGIVEQVGKGVKHVKVGDRVATSQAMAFSSVQTIHASRVLKLPDNISFEVGASVKSVYNTAHYALVDLARVRKGDRVLVHAAAGGVGHAAVSICHFLGAEVYATASKPKHTAVAALGVPEDRIFDSRDFSWFQGVMSATDGKGVHVVLNCLAGKHQKLGLEALCCGGRFLEIGKMDVYRNASIGQLALSKNASFTAIDMDRMARDDPQTTDTVTKTVYARLAEGAYQPIPYVSFPMSRMKEAMDFMKAAKHVGKVVLVNHEEGPDGVERPVTVRAKLSQSVFGPDGTYLVTGGAGGFGSRIVQWAAANGARHIVVTVSSNASRVARIHGHLMEELGVSVEVVEADLSKEADVRRVVEFASTRKHPLVGIFHCAGFSLDVTLPNIERGQLDQIAGPKNDAAMWLHEGTKDLATVKHFVVISSVAADTTSEGVMLYAASNAMLNAFVRYRRSLGLPAAALNMTSLYDVGILANNTRVRELQLKSGWEMMPSSRALLELTELACSGKESLVQMQLRRDAAGYGPNRPNFFHEITEPFIIGTQAGIANRLDRQGMLKFLIGAIQDVVKNPDVGASSLLVGLGMDSLSRVELSGRVTQTTGLSLNFNDFKMTSTVGDVADALSDMLDMADAKGEGEGDEHDPQQLTQEEDPDAPASASVPRARVDPSRVRSVFDQDPDEDGQKEKEGYLGEESPRSQRSSDLQSQSHSDTDSGDQTTSTSPAKSSRRWLSIPWSGKLGNSAKEKEVDGEAMAVAEARKWVRTLWGRPHAPARLLVIPGAGGSVAPFELLALDNAQIMGVEVPGRDGRANETPVTNIEAIARGITQALDALGMLQDSRPLSILGHSLGAIVGLEVCRQLKLRHNYVVERLFNAACPSPHQLSYFLKLPIKSVVVPFLSTAGGVDRETASGATGDLKELRDYVTRQNKALRSEPSKIKTPIVCMVGRSDRLTSLLSPEAWRAYTHAQCTVERFPGAHTFVFEPDTAIALTRFLDGMLGQSQWEGETKECN